MEREGALDLAERGGAQPNRTAGGKDGPVRRRRGGMAE